MHTQPRAQNPRIARWVRQVAVCAALGVSVATAQQKPASGPTTHAEIQLDHFLREPRPMYESFALAAATEAAGDKRAQDVLRQAFARVWIAGESSPLTIEQFRALAERCPPFGPNQSLLIEMLATTEAPAALRNPLFLQFVRDRLASIQTRRPVDALLRPGFPAAPREVLGRYSFLLEVLPPEAGARIRDALAQRLAAAPPADMLGYDTALNELAGASFLRFHANGEAQSIRRVLGDRLFRLPVGSWPEAGRAIGPLAAGSSVGPLRYLQRASDFFRADSKRRTPQAAIALAALATIAAGGSDPAAAHRLLHPEQNVEWFAWLHEAGTLTALHQREDLLAASYQQLLRFAARDLRMLFPRTVLYYYDRVSLRDRVFNEIIAPAADGPYAAEVLGQAIAFPAGYQPQHREDLARRVLARPATLDPAWSGPGAPERLAFAIAVWRIWIRRASNS
jgi:hypothetical protein